MSPQCYTHVPKMLHNWGLTTIQCLFIFWKKHDEVLWERKYHLYKQGALIKLSFQIRISSEFFWFCPHIDGSIPNCPHNRRVPTMMARIKIYAIIIHSATFFIRYSALHTSMIFGWTFRINKFNIQVCPHNVSANT